MTGKRSDPSRHVLSRRRCEARLKKINGTDANETSFCWLEPNEGPFGYLLDRLG